MQHLDLQSKITTIIPDELKNEIYNRHELLKICRYLIDKNKCDESSLVINLIKEFNLQSHSILQNQIKSIIPDKLKKQIYDKYDILSLAVYLTDKYEFEEAFIVFKIAQNINDLDEDETFKLLEYSVLEYIFNNEKIYKKEYTLYKPIKNFINELIPNSKIIEHKIIKKKVPDLFLEVNGEFSVGEIKPDDFTDAHIKQLKMYMDVYKCKTGYAFGKYLTGILYDNMIFIDFKDVKDRYYKRKN